MGKHIYEKIRTHKGVGSGRQKARDGIHHVQEHCRRTCGTARDPSHTGMFHAREGLKIRQLHIF